MTAHAMLAAGAVAGLLVLGNAALALADRRVCQWANETDSPQPADVNEHNRKNC